MSEPTVDVPAVGRVPKKYVYIGGALVAGIVGYAWWKQGSAPVEDIPAYTDEDVADGVTDTSGGVAGSSANSGGTTVDTSTTPDTDSEWVMMARDALSGTFDDASFAIALGKYIGREGMSTAEQQMVRAAIGAVGYPPGGKYPLETDTSGSPSTFQEPTGLKVTATTSTSVTVSWTKVTGASGYRLYRGDTGNEPVGDSGDTTAILRGLQPNKTYTVRVAARTGTGAAGPLSQPLTVKTSAVKLAKPATPTVTAITKSTAKVSTKAVSGADRYGWYVNGVAHGSSDAPSYTIQSLKASTTYRVSVAADNATQAPGPQSAVKSFKTKAK